MTVPKPGWVEIAWRESWDSRQVPTTWEMPYRGGFLVLHASPTGAETMVFVPDPDMAAVAPREAVAA